MGAFVGCAALESVTVDDGNQNYTSLDGVLYNKDCSVLKCLPGMKKNFVSPSSVKEIGDYSCYDGQLESVELSDGIEIIGEYAFGWNYHMTKVKLPSTLKTIRGAAFHGCEALADVYVSNMKAWCETVMANNYSNPMEYAKSFYLNGEKIEDKVDIPVGTKSVASFTFYNFSGLKTIDVAEGVTNVCAYAFWSCTNLCRASLPKSIDQISSIAFLNCTNLMSMVFCGDAPRIKTYKTVYTEPQFYGVADGCTINVFDGSTGWNVDIPGTWAELRIEYMNKDCLLPDINDYSTKAEIAFALNDAVDANIVDKIYDVPTYNSFKSWAGLVKGYDSDDAAGVEVVMNSETAWVSFALGSDKLLEQAPKDEDLTVEKFEPSGEAGEFDFTVSVEGVEVGSDAQKENLKQVFGLEGATTLDPNAFTSGNVDLTFGTPEDGKVKFTAGPKDTDATTFFMKVRVNP